MKKTLSALLAFCIISMSFVAIFTTTVGADDIKDSITVSDLQSFNAAIKSISDGGTIVIDGTIVPSSTGHFIMGTKTGKSFTITGGTFDFTSLTSGDNERGMFSICDNITFEKTKFIFDSTNNDYMFASGYDITISESVAFEGKAVCFFAGSYLNTSNPITKGKSNNVTLLSGNYTTVNGMSHGSAYSISEDVYVHLGGNASAGTVLGNSGSGTIPGNVNIWVDGNAKADVIWGGGNGGTVKGNVTVTVAGQANVKKIYGGGNAGTINGNTYVIVKDNANPSATPSTDDHSDTYAVYGGGKGIINGSTNVYFMDNAKAGYVVGGMPADSTGSIGNGANVFMMGGLTYSLYGVGRNVDHGTGANIVMTGGTAHQVFGGCESTNVKGDITIKLLGGTVLRRVYGGCYNESAIIFWSSSYFVEGTITLVIGEKMNMALNSESDHGFSAHSRRKNNDSSEIGVVIYTSDVAKASLSSKLSKGVSGGKTHDHTHLYTYSLNDNVITQTCTEHSDHSATATITSANTVYNGNAHEIAIAYSDKWEYDKFDIAYANNVNAGEACATISLDGIHSFEYKYTISKAAQSAPKVSLGSVHGTITSLATAMEYSTDGTTYVPVTDVNMVFAVGTYYIRYCENENYLSSEATVIIIEEYVEPETTEPETTEPETTEPETTEPETTEPETTEPETTESETTEPETTEPETTEPETTETEDTEAETDGSSGSNGSNGSNGENSSNAETDAKHENESKPSSENTNDNEKVTSAPEANEIEQVTEEKGCGGSINGFGAVILTVPVIGFFAKKKKE